MSKRKQERKEQLISRKKDGTVFDAMTVPMTLESALRFLGNNREMVKNRVADGLTVCWGEYRLVPGTVVLS